MKKPGKVEKRAAVAVCDRVFSTDSAGHVSVVGIVYLGVPAETIDGPPFYRLVSREMPSLKVPDGWLLPRPCNQKKSRNSSVTRC